MTNNSRVRGMAGVEVTAAGARFQSRLFTVSKSASPTPGPLRPHHHAASRARLEEPAVAFVDDHRADVGLIEQVVHAHEGAQFAGIEPPTARAFEVQR